MLLIECKPSALCYNGMYIYTACMYRLCKLWLGMVIFNHDLLKSQSCQGMQCMFLVIYHYITFYY